MGAFKIKGKLFVFVLFTILLASLATAAINVEGNKVTIDVDYNDFRDEDDTHLSISQSFALTNDAAADEIVELSIENLPQDYTADPIAQVTVPANGTVSVSVAINVPHEQNSGETKIGDVVISNPTGQELKRVDLIQNTESMLELKEFKVKYVDEDGRSRSDSFDEDDSEFKLSHDVRPGTEAKVTMKLRNRFDRDYDDDKNEIEDIIVRFDVDDSDIYGDDEIDDEYDVSNIDPEEEETIEITFDVDEEADAGSYTWDIEIDGQDTENADHRLRKSFVLEVKRLRDDVRITRADFSQVTACDPQITLDMKLRNFGTSDQRFAALSISGPSLSITENVARIEINEFDDDDDQFERTFRWPMRSTTKAGTYAFDITAYIDGDEQIDYKRVNLEIGACPSAVQPVVEPEPVVAPPTPEPVSDANTQEASGANVAAAGAAQDTSAPEADSDASVATGSSTIVKTVENSYSTEDILIAGIIIAIILVLGLIVLFFIILLRR